MMSGIERILYMWSNVVFVVVKPTITASAVKCLQMGLNLRDLPRGSRPQMWVPGCRENQGHIYGHIYICINRAPQGGVPCYMLYGFSMGLLYAITKILTLL